MGKKPSVTKENRIESEDEKGLGRESVLSGPIKVSPSGIRMHLGSDLGRALRGDEKFIRAIAKTNRFTVQEVLGKKSKKPPEKK